MIITYRHLDSCCENIFSWDTAKDATNKRLSGRPSFELASFIFHDPTHLTDFNRTSRGEDREQTLGKIGSTVFFVVHSIRIIDNVETIRIISARKATKSEVRAYIQRTRA
ncbi:MAG: BrnT family toxin [Candidatus Obscuribacterales bacterium]|nr:BrnT family toxin [Candidatus Obscuribacterales bacterium]